MRKTLGIALAIAAILTICSPVSWAQTTASGLSIKKVMTQAQFEAAGLQKLTSAELASLSAWLESFSAQVAMVAVQTAGKELEGRPSLPSQSRKGEYEVEVSHNDELFIINGEKFEAKTYCFNIEPGDQVIFIEGSPFGACAAATFVNLRTKDKCEVWCE